MVAISVHSVVWWRMEEAKNRKLYTARGMSTVLANVIVFPERKPSTLLCYYRWKMAHLNTNVNSASNCSEHCGLHGFREMSFVLCPSNPQHSAIIANNTSSPVVLHYKHLTTAVKVSNSEKQGCPRNPKSVTSTKFMYINSNLHQQLIPH